MFKLMALSQRTLRKGTLRGVLASNSQSFSSKQATMQQPKKTYKKGMQDRNNQASKHRISLRERHIYNLNRQNAKMFRYVQI